MMRFDVFPAVVVTDGRSFSHARAAMTEDGRFAVWRQDRRTAQVEVVVLGQATDATPTPDGRRTKWTVTHEGGTIDVTKAGGCGCSNPMKRWTPEGVEAMFG